jgi:hypothetical protein
VDGAWRLAIYRWPILVSSTPLVDAYMLFSMARSRAMLEGFLMGPKATRCSSGTPHNSYLCLFNNRATECYYGVSPV